MKNILDSFAFFRNKQSVKTIGNKFKISILSIFLGLVFGSLIMMFMGYNPFAVFHSLITFSFQTKAKINTLLIFTSIFTLSALANGIAFKTGLFNIGVPGQMIAGGATSMYLALTYFKHIDPYLAMFLFITIAILVGSLVGLLVGLLKTKFNVNEVVSTILLNWIIFFLFKYLYRVKQNFVTPTGDSKLISKSYYFGGIHKDAWITPLIIVISICIILFLILKFSSFGRKIVMTGLGKSGSKYFGIKVNRTVIFSFLISSGIAGLLGFVYYFTKQHFVGKFESTLPTYGFDGIAITLLAFNSPIVTPFIAFFYSIFQTGVGGTEISAGIQNETVALIFSIIIYFSAISSLFLRFKPITFLIVYYKSLTLSSIKRRKAESRTIIKRLKFVSEGIILKLEYNEMISKTERKVKIKDEKNRMNLEAKQIKRECKLEVYDQIKTNIHSHQIFVINTSIIYIKKFIREIYLINRHNEDLKSDLKIKYKNLISILTKERNALYQQYKSKKLSKEQFEQNISTMLENKGEVKEW